MLLSPGSMERSLTEGSEIFRNLNLFEKIIYNLENFSEYMILKKPTMLLLMTWVINCTIDRSSIKHKWFYYFFFNCIPVLTIIFNLRYVTPIVIGILNFDYPNFLDFGSKWYLVYWFIFFCSFLYSIYFILKNNKDKMLYIYFFNYYKHGFLYCYVDIASMV